MSANTIHIILHINISYLMHMLWIYSGVSVVECIHNVGSDMTFSALIGASFPDKKAKSLYEKEYSNSGIYIAS